MNRCFLGRLCMSIIKNREAIKEWLAILGPILVGFVTGMSFVISAYINKQPAVVYEIQQTPYFEKANTIRLFPLKTGNIWHYKGKVQIPDFDHGDNTFEKEIELTMEVAEEISAQDLTLFVMKGHWQDLYDYWPAIKKEQMGPVIIPAREYGYLVISNKIYHIPPDHLEKLIQFMRSEDEFIAPLEPSWLEFEFPLFKGQRYGPAPNISRKDFNFCWYVNDEIYDHIANDNQVLSVPRYLIVFNSLIEYFSISFEANRGIISFDYHHQGANVNGTLMLHSCDLR